MPVSHIGLTVAHLPTSCSFFLAALQPLGYCYIGQQGNQIGFGVRGEADFFICQETAGLKATAAHIAFAASSRPAVNAFFTAALKAGGTIHGEPAVRDADSGYYNAAVLDFDGNSIEVVHRATDVVDTKPEGSRVLTWQRDVARSFADGRSVVRASRGPAPTVVGASVPPPPGPAIATNAQGDAGAKALIGTLLGAAAGAAVAYAMTKGEDSSTTPSASASTSGAGTVPALAAAAQTLYRAIEAGPQRSQPTAPPTIVLQDLECDPAFSPSQARSQVRSSTSSHRPRTPLRAIEAPPPQAQSVVARSTLIHTFVAPSEVPVSRRTRPAPPPAAAKSETQLSVRIASASASQHAASRPATVVRATSTQDVRPRSLVGSVLGLGLDAGTGAKNDEVRGGKEVEAASVAPSDSVSRAGSKRHRSREHRSHSKSRSGAGGSKAEASSTSRTRTRPGGSRQGSFVGGTGTRLGMGGESVVRGEVEEVESPEEGRSRASSQRTVRQGDVGGGGKKGTVVSVPPALGRTGSWVGGGGGGQERSVVSLGLVGMGLGAGIGKGTGSSVESRAGGARGWA